LKNNNFGKINDDANTLAKMLRKDSEERQGFFDLATNSTDQLSKLCYMSKRMKKVADAFSDVLIIDGSHQTNRFNMHLLDRVAINNLGKTTNQFNYKEEASSSFNN